MTLKKSALGSIYNEVNVFLVNLRLSFRYSVEDGCTEEIFYMFRKSWNLIWIFWQTGFIIVRKEKIMQKIDFWVFFFTPFDWKISSKNFFCNALKVGFLSLKNPKTTSKMKILEEEKTSCPRFSRNLGHDFFLSPKTLVLVFFLFFFKQRPNLLTSTVFELWFFYYLK